MKIRDYLSVTVLGLILLGLTVWWIYDRRVPTVRVSYTLGKGRSVDIDWINLRDSNGHQARSPAKQ